MVFRKKKSPFPVDIVSREEKENFTVIVGNHTRKRTDGGAINSILYADEMDARAIDSSAFTARDGAGLAGMGRGSEGEGSGSAHRAT